MWFFFINLSIISLLSVVAVFVMLWFRRRIGNESLKRNHEVAGVVYAVIGTIFAVTLALMVDTVNDEYGAAEKHATAEAVQIANLHQLAEWFPGEGEARLKRDLKLYAEAVIEKEWGHVRPNRMVDTSVPAAAAAFQQVALSIRTLEAVTPQQQAAYSEAVGRLTELREARFHRLYGARSEFPFPLLFIVIFGGVVTIGFTMFFSMDNQKAQVLIIFLLSALIWSNVLVIFQVQFPFNGIDVTPPRALLSLLGRN